MSEKNFLDNGWVSHFEAVERILTHLAEWLDTDKIVVEFYCGDFARLGCNVYVVAGDELEAYGSDLADAVYKALEEGNG